MRKHWVILWLTVAMMTGVTAVAADKNETIVAHVGERAVTFGELVRFVAAFSEDDDALAAAVAEVDAMSVADKRRLVKTLVTDERLLARGEKDDVLRRRVDSGDLRRRIERHRDNLLINAYIDKTVAAQISNDEIAARYQQAVKLNEGKREFHLRFIMTDTKEAIEKAVARLKVGEEFPDVARAFSVDDTIAANGGDVGYVPETALVPELLTIIEALQPGTVSESFELSGRFHLVQLLDTRPVVVPPLDEMRDTIYESLFEQTQRRFLGGIVPDGEIRLVDSNGDDVAAP